MSNLLPPINKIAENKITNLKIQRSDEEACYEDDFDEIKEDIQRAIEADEEAVIIGRDGEIEEPGAEEVSQKKVKEVDQKKTKEVAIEPVVTKSETPQMTVSLAHRQIVVNRLNSLGLDGEMFCQKIKEAKCLMAGSFPLQCLLGETYKGSDVDIFIARPKVFKTNGNPHDDLNFMAKVRNFDIFEQWLFGRYRIKSKPNIYLIRDVICSRKYQITPDACVNIVLVDTDNLEKHIKTTFDLSFCQTIFDGEQLKYWEMSLKKVGYVVNKDNLKERQPHHISEDEYNRQMAKNKNISWPDFHPNHDDSRLIRVYPDRKATITRRIDKYKSRGFLIVDSATANYGNLDSLRLTQMTNDYKAMCKLNEEKLAELTEIKKELALLKEKSKDLEVLKQKLAEKEKMKNDSQELATLKAKLAKTQDELESERLERVLLRKEVDRIKEELKETQEELEETAEELELETREKFILRKEAEKLQEELTQKDWILNQLKSAFRLLKE